MFSECIHILQKQPYIDTPGPGLQPGVNNSCIIITKAYLCNFDPLNPDFYIVKLGFTGVCIICLFLLENIDCGYSLEPPRRGGSYECHNLCFPAEIWKISEFLSEIFQFFGGEIFNIFEKDVFVMHWQILNSFLKALNIQLIA